MVHLKNYVFYFLVSETIPFHYLTHMFNCTWSERITCKNTLNLIIPPSSYALLIFKFLNFICCLMLIFLAMNKVCILILINKRNLFAPLFSYDLTYFRFSSSCLLRFLNLKISSVEFDHIEVSIRNFSMFWFSFLTFLILYLSKELSSWLISWIFSKQLYVAPPTPSTHS